MRRMRVVTLGLALLALTALGRVEADDKAPAYEVKFLLDPQAALKCACKPLSAVEPDLPSGLDVAEDDPARISFFDTEDRTLSADNWIVRVRRKGDKVKVTHKWRRRFEGDVKKAVEKAEAQGQSVSEAEKIEVDWGSPREGTGEGAKTLGFSYEGGAMDDGLAASCAAARGGPTPFKDFRKKVTARYGPIAARTWTVKDWAGIDKVEIEVWALPNGTYMVEASTKTDEEKKAEKARDKLITALTEAGLLAFAQSSKTAAALAAFDPERCPPPP